MENKDLQQFLKVSQEVNQFLSDSAKFLAFVVSKMQELNQRLSQR